MTTEEIYQKYIKAMQQATGDGTWVDWGVVRLGLRLAIAEAYDAAPAIGRDLAAIIASQDKEIERMIAERAVFAAQLVRLNEWLEEHTNANYWSDADTVTSILNVIADKQNQIEQCHQQLAAMDADNAALLKRCAGLEVVVSDVMQQRDAAQAEIDRLTHQNTIAIDTLNSIHPAAIHTNGNGASQAAPAWHANLDDETNDWRVSIEAGRRTWRQIPKAQRLLIFQAVARSLSGNGAMPTQALYDEHKPAWMPTGTGIASTFACNWAELLTLRPFEVLEVAA